jgi:serine/threonine protein kinase
LYMAPERFRDSGVNDPRSDLYSLGAVGYKLLTGQDVFTSTSMVNLLQEILEVPAARPSSRVPQAIPAALDQLIIDCLAKDPAQRPSTADAVLARLAVIVCEVPWDQEQARQWWASHADREPLACRAAW